MRKGEVKQGRIYMRTGRDGRHYLRRVACFGDAAFCGMPTGTMDQRCLQYERVLASGRQGPIYGMTVRAFEDWARCEITEVQGTFMCTCCHALTVHSKQHGCLANDTGEPCNCREFKL